MNVSFEDKSPSQLREMIMARVLYGTGWELFLRHVFSCAETNEMEMPDELLEDWEQFAITKREELQHMVEAYLLKVLVEYS